MTVPSWTDISKFEHEEVLEGTSKVRKLWDNLRFLAGDDTSGYGQEGNDIATTGNFPVGFALCVLRNPGLLTHTSGQRWTGVHWGYELEGQQMFFRRAQDQLWYRSKGASLWYIGADGEWQSQSLDDHDDDEDILWNVLYLGSIDGLFYGQWYCLRTEDRDVGEGQDHPYIEFAFERSA